MKGEVREEGIGTELSRTKRKVGNNQRSFCAAGNCLGVQHHLIHGYPNSVCMAMYHLSKWTAIWVSGVRRWGEGVERGCAAKLHVRRPKYTTAPLHWL